MDLIKSTTSGMRKAWWARDRRTNQKRSAEGLMMTMMVTMKTMKTIVVMMVKEGGTWHMTVS
jgi:hypothetical protein